MKSFLLIITNLIILVANNMIDRFIKAAQSQIGVTTIIKDLSYVKITFHR